MDGVIVDSNPHHRLAWEAFNRSYGVETTEAMHGRMYGKRNDKIVRDFFGAGLSDEEVDARGAAKEALYREMIGGQVESMLVPGLRDFLDRYREIPKAVASNAEPANVDFLLDQSGLRPYFSVVLNGHQVSHPKPDPEIYLRAAELLQGEGIDCEVMVVASINPAPVDDLKRSLSKFRQAVTVEAHYAAGGLCSLVSEVVAQSGINCRITRCAIESSPDGETGGQAFLYNKFGISAEAVALRAKALLCGVVA